MTAETKIINSESADTIDDEDVRSYLKDHADFFERHPDMLDFLHISHNSGHAVSLVEKQVSVLRERNIEMRKRLNTLTENARDNDRLYDATRSLVLKLLDAGSLDELGQVFARAMNSEFGVEHACLIVFAETDSASGQCRVESADTARIEVGALLKNRRATCGALRQEELAYLFPGTSDIGSAAVMPLHNGGDLGVIAVASSDPAHYTSSMGTLFLTHIAEVLVRLLPKLCNRAQ